MPCDVIVAGAGPAGSLAATILARGGAQVRLVDRARFPRDKLCGDTLNPGAMRVLAAHVPIAEIERRAVALEGMLLTGPRAAVLGRYPGALRARALTRLDLDMLLLRQALDAGVCFDENVAVIEPLRNTSNGTVCGVALRTRGGRRVEEHARLVIAADGRESRLARAAGLARHPRSPRRWAIGGYFEGVLALAPVGEMHVRAGHYIGVAPVPGGLANTCLVIPRDDGRRHWKDSSTLLTDVVRSDCRLRDRFERARLVAPPHVLGPMAVDVDRPGVPGMLLAGDAAGFIDPITGDGLHFALSGAALTASVAADLLAGRLPLAAAADALAARRREVFAAKWRFNRAIRALVSQPAGVAAAAGAARALPWVFQRMIKYAGDCGAATPQPSLP